MLQWKQFISFQELLYPNLLRSFQKAMAPLYSKSKAVKNKVNDDEEYESILGVWEQSESDRYFTYILIF